MEENANQIQREIDGMVKNLRKIVKEAQTARHKEKSWKMWRPIQIVMWKMRLRDKNKSQLSPSIDN